MKKIIICIFSVFTVFSLLYATGCAQEEDAGAFGLGVGNKAKDFTLMDIDGKEVNLKDFIEKNVVFLVFSTTWCPSCVREIPELKTIHKEYSKKGLKIINIYVGESQVKVTSFAKDKKIPYTVLLDSDNKVAAQYRVRGVPTLMVIDKKGVIRERGYPPSKRFLTVFDKLLKE